MNFNICALCQTKDNKKLIKPNVYTAIANNIVKFNKLKCYPIINNYYNNYESGNEIETFFKENSAKWHKDCANKLNNLKLQRIVKKCESNLNIEADTDPSTSKNTRHAKPKSEQKVCFFCDKAGKIPLHIVQTLELDNKVRRYAVEINDHNILRKTCTGDLIALELKYHLSCLQGFYRRVEKFRKEKERLHTATSVEGIALAYLLDFIKSSREPDKNV